MKPLRQRRKRSNCRAPRTASPWHATLSPWPPGTRAGTTTRWTASLQSVGEYRERHDGDPYEYAALLADALTDHALIRTLRAERAEAEAAIAESLAMHRELAAANPGRYQRELDRALEVAAQLG